MAAIALSVTLVGAQVPVEKKYPDFSGQWSRSGGAQWDPDKGGGLRQQAPLTPEYQAIFEANLKALNTGDDSFNLHVRCINAGMPRLMIAYEPLEIIATPHTTYIRDYFNEFRRIFTDGRNWPGEIKPAFGGYSIGQWQDTDNDGTYDTLLVETRGFRGPRHFDANGLPLHRDNQTVIKEKLFLDKTNRDILIDEVVTVDNALTRPWTVVRKYLRERDPVWPHYLCTEDNHHITIGKETYLLSADRHLMPIQKDQPPPDLRHFDRVR
jgi:hypothetical protein